LNATFTQADIDSDLVTYLHNGSQTIADIFEFSVEDGKEDGVTAITNQTFNLAITPVNQAPVIITNTGITVNEFVSVTITSSELQTTDVDATDSELIYTITKLPINGKLQLNYVELFLNDTFTQADINADRLKYIHDGSETTTDSFFFTIEDGEENGVVPLVENRFLIEIIKPVILTINDAILYPNPSEIGVEKFFLKNIHLSSEVSLFSVLGRPIPIKTRIENRSIEVMPSQNLTAGFYLVRIKLNKKVKYIKWLLR